MMLSEYTMSAGSLLSIVAETEAEASFAFLVIAPRKALHAAITMIRSCPMLC
jgi:hypothetical protein